MQTVVILYNPQSGDGDKQSLIAEVQNYLHGKGLTKDKISLIGTESAQHAFDMAKYATQAGVELIVTMGGDGTINKIAAGIYEGGGTAALGIIPAGTVNNFAKALQIPRERSAAIKNLLEGKPKAIDLAQVNDEYMISSLTLGILADIAVDVKQEEKRQFGALAFLKNAFKIIRRNRNYYLTLLTEGTELKVKTKLLLITMTSSVAGQVNFDRDAKPDDGLMSVYLMSDFRFWRVLRYLPSFVRGDFAKHSDIKHFRTSRLQISQYKHRKSQKARTRVDGDKSQYLPISLEVLPSAISVMVPENTHP
ncbi:diacylglycerol kinase family protein [Streptococcus merionis]|uniref:diacylglycerol/lipid kinase family protein n=1 Tax=Streptococcus merionis TaxID=400065 RepID=UPI0026EEE31D|nr:diacylglycerol kinase family protein [Streptococcus merionis]